MSAPLNIRVRGIRQKIQQGYIVGRAPNTGAGPAQLVDAATLTQQIYAAGGLVAGGGSPTGLLPVVDGSILANISGITAIPIANTLSAILDHDLGSTQGDILYRGASVWALLPPGAAPVVGGNQQFLRTGGSGANPAWANGAINIIQGGTWNAANSYAPYTVVRSGASWYINNQAITGPVGTAAPAVDGTPATASGNSSSTSLTLTTTATNDVIYVAVAGDAAVSISSVSSTHTTSWARRGRIVIPATINGVLDVWAGTAATALSGEAITVNFSGGIDYAAVAFGIKNAINTGGSYFDPNASVPTTASGSASVPAATITTTNGNDLLLFFNGIANSGLDTSPPTGWSLVTSKTNITASGVSVFSQAITSPQSSSPIVSGSEAFWGVVFDAVTAVGNPAQDPRWIEIATVDSAAIDAAFGSAQGDILYRDSAAWQVLAPGSVSGQVLTTGGAGANPSWQTAASGGSGLFSPIMSTVPSAANTGLSNWYNQGTSTVADSSMGINISSANATAVHGRYKTAPATPYTVTAQVMLNGQGINFVSAGIGWTDGTKVLGIVFQWNSGAAVQAQTWTNSTTFGSALTTLAQPTQIWLQLTNNGTNYTMAVSTDGANFVTVNSGTLSGSFLGATGFVNVMFYHNSQGAATSATLTSYKD